MGKPPDARRLALSVGAASRREGFTLRYRPWRLPLGEDRAALPLCLCGLKVIYLTLLNQKTQRTDIPEFLPFYFCLVR
ncbi:hypothetical protein H6G93_30360 [Nostoc sp. FACHB-973]|nr:hypothetical protein [Nostoc sp. FACHB-973]